MKPSNKVGFSHSECRCIAVELGPSDTEIKSFNRALIERSGSKLAPIDVEHIRFASVAGSHLNAGLNAIAHGVEHESPELTLNGKLSLSKISEIDAEYAKAVQDGLDWLIVSNRVVAAFPSFASLLQSAYNVGGHLQRSESELQLLRKIHHSCLVHERTTGKSQVLWSDVKASVLKSKPTHSLTCPSLFTFCVKFSGGCDGHLLQETEDFVKAFGYQRRSLGAEVYDALSVDLKGREQRPIYRHCTYKCKVQHNVFFKFLLIVLLPWKKL